MFAMCICINKCAYPEKYRAHIRLPSSGKVKRVDEAQGCCSSSTTRSQISKEVAHKLCVFVDATKENLLVFVFEGKVQSLSWEVPDDIGKVTTPVTQESLFLWNAHETIDHTWNIEMHIFMVYFLSAIII